MSISPPPPPAPPTSPPPPPASISAHTKKGIKSIFPGKDVTGWSLKNIFLPMLPFFIGTGIRAIVLKEASIKALGLADLSFSMAMLFLLLFIAASRLDDDALRDSLTTIVATGFTLFVVLFTVTTFIEVIVNSRAERVLASVVEDLKSGGTNIPSIMKNHSNPFDADYGGMMDIVRVVILVLAIISVPATICLRNKYKL